MSIAQYILHVNIRHLRYISVCLAAMIRMQIDQLLKNQKRSFYWLAKETGVSHTTLWRLKKDKAQGITFNTLERICEALKCQPGDVLKVGAKSTKARQKRGG